MEHRLTYYSMKGSENDGWYLRPGVTQEQARTRLAAYENIEPNPELVREIIKMSKAGTWISAEDYDELAAYRACFPIERAQELAKIEREGRLMIAQIDDGRTVEDYVNEYFAKLEAEAAMQGGDGDGN